MSGVSHIAIGAADAGQRLDRWLRSRYPQLTQGRIEKMLRKGDLRIDGARVKAGARLAQGQTVRVPPLPQDAAPPPAPRPRVSEADVAWLESLILYRDAHVIALAKPPGVPVQGGTGQTRHIDGMLDALAERGERPRLAHRLDKDTSGVLMLARTAAAARALTGAFRSKAARKLYWAAVIGVPRPRAGTIAWALAKAPGPQGEKMLCVDPRALDQHPEARRAVTDYAVVGQAATRAAWVALRPVTGRTHQLRAHMAQIGCPIVGDGKYGPRAEEAERRLEGAISRKLHLHARRISVPHPDGSGRILTVSAPMPEHMAQTWRTFEWDPALGDEPDLLPDPS